MSDQINFGWILLVFGLFIAVVGLVWLLAPSIPWLGRLPGDIRIERENFRFVFPVVTCLLLSVLLSAIVWVVRYFTAK
jgi:hypothetical protein